MKSLFEVKFKNDWCLNYVLACSFEEAEMLALQAQVEKVAKDREGSSIFYSDGSLNLSNLMNGPKDIVVESIRLISDKVIGL